MARTAGSDGTATKARILAVAARLIAVQGFDALSMRALAAASGLQVGALYHYFPDKQSLLVHLLQRHFELLEAEFAAETAENNSPADQLLSFCMRHVRFHALHRLSTLLVLHDMRSLDRAIATPVLKQRQHHELRLQQILTAGIAAGAFRSVDTQIAAKSTLAFLTETAIWYREGGSRSLDEIAQDCPSMVLSMLRV